LVATGAITAAKLRKKQQTAIIIAVSIAASPKAKNPEQQHPKQTAIITAMSTYSDTSKS